jgi:deoxyribodipyrimidine photo-lyase
MNVQLVWLKRDLRILDHAALFEAAARGPVIALYVYEPEWLDSAECDPAHLHFINDSLAELREVLARRGGQLTLRVGRIPEAFDEFAQAYDLQALWSHEETGVDWTYGRDKRVAVWARQRGIPWFEIPQTGVVRALRGRDGWERLRNDRMGQPVLPAPPRLASPDGHDPGHLRGAEAFALSPTRRPLAQQGGETRAHRLLQAFLDRRGVNYRADMAAPSAAWTGCSRLSPHLAWGTLSVRQAVQATTARQAHLRAAREAGEPVDTRWSGSLISFQSRLAWHCHFMQKLEDQPDLEWVNMARMFDGMREEAFDQTRFDAWCAGQTGYPLVDACMRALHASGWINFRMRALLVSFASYHLWLDWRPTGRYLARQFLDFEPGIHYCQMQMQSGVTGINTIRIYAPAKQAVDVDPDGHFIRRFVPELAGVPLEFLAEPHRMPPLLQAAVGCVIGRDYPAPIVDHGSAMAAAKAAVFARREGPEAVAEAKRIYERHGSRRIPFSRRRS